MTILPKYTHWSIKNDQKYEILRKPNKAQKMAKEKRTHKDQNQALLGMTLKGVT